MPKSRILVIDDEAAIRDSLRMTLEYEGYEFIGAATGQEGLALAEQFRREQGLEYDLIHAHYWLSGVAGLALREMWDAPLVQMFHTLGRLKNTVAQTAAEVGYEIEMVEILSSNPA